MGRQGLKELVREIADRPLTADQRGLFVDRNEELLSLSQLPEYFEGGIIGVAGERGIGKTTLFNMVRFPGREKVVINVVNRENKLTILGDIIEGLKEYAEKRRIKEMTEQLGSLLSKVQLSAKFLLSPVGMEVKLERGKGLPSVRELIRELNHVLERLGEKTPIVVILDEIDKEKKEELLLVMDAIKDGFKSNPTTLVVALPYSIYEEFNKATLEASDTYNLDNVFDHIMLIHPLSDSDIESIIHSRMPSHIAKEAVDAIVQYARGNPRRAVRLLKEAGITALRMGAKEIKRDHVLLSLKRQLKPLVEALGRRALRVLKAMETSSSVREAAKKVRVSLPTLYKDLRALERYGLMEGNKPTPFGLLVIEALGL